jgi:uncharacterized protein
MIELLNPIFDLLFALLLIRLVYRTIVGTRRPRTAAPSRPSERQGGRLVRDPQCGTYVPLSRALRVGSGDDARYFCSTDCRDAYAAAHGH